jgi:transposase
VGAGRADDPAGQARRPATRGERPRGPERHLLRALDRVPMGSTAERLAAEEHGTSLLHAVGLGRDAGAYPLRALCRDARAGRPRGEPNGRDHRQPKRQSGSKGGSTLDPQGFDAGKKVTGRKRHILVDTLGLLLNVVVHSAAVQDRDGARLVLDRRTRRLFPFIERIFADAGYQGPKTAAAIAKTGTWKLEIVKRNELHRFVVLPKRWIVERTLAWISHNRRLARDFERYARSAAAFIRLAMIRIMLRRLIQPAHCS